MATQQVRKTPTQTRAKNTVARILSATAELIAEIGLDSITTNKIAKHADINIASIYQYYSDKDAIINALIRQFQNNLVDRLNSLLEGMENLPLEPATRQIVTVAVQELRQTHDTAPSLISNLGSNRTLSAMRELESRFLEAMRRYLIKRRDDLDLGDIDSSIYIIYTATAAIVGRHLNDPTPYLTDEEVVEEIVRLMVRYFSKPVAAQPTGNETLQ